jgi:hypothetical protein
MAAFSLFRLFRAKQSGDPARQIADFLSLPEHGWIRQNPALLRRVAGFFSQLPAQDLDALFGSNRLLLLYSNGKMSCAFHQFQGREVVLIFPDLRRLLLSAQFGQGYAILAHEVAHVLLGHSRKKIAPLQAQLEADRYASDLGFGEELCAVLGDEEAGDEIARRLAALEVLS